MQTLPRIINVAVFCDQHSVRLGHFALSQTVSNRKSEMTASVNCIPGFGIGRFNQRGKRRRGAFGGGASMISSRDMNGPSGSFQQMMAGVNMESAVSEPFNQPANDCLAHGVHRGMSQPLRRQRRDAAVGRIMPN